MASVEFPGSSTSRPHYHNIPGDSLSNSSSGPYFYTTEAPPSNNSSCTQCEVLNSVSHFLTQYSIWIIFAFGFPGNLISFCVIVRMSRQRLTTSLLYITVLAVVDNLAIVLKIIDLQNKNGSLIMNPIECKFLAFSGLTLVAYANWILIVMSAERYTAVGFPLKVGIIWSLRRAVAIIVVVFLFLCAVHLHVFVTVHQRGQLCGVREEFVDFFNYWWYFISSSIFSFIPAISIIIFNILIIRLMRKSTVRRTSLLSSPRSSVKESRQQERQVTVMLVTLALVFTVLTTPRCVFIITHIYWQPEHPLGIAWKGFINQITNSLADSNHAVNFYLYFVAITKFRHYFLDIAKCHNTTNKLFTGGPPLSNPSLKGSSPKSNE